MAWLRQLNLESSVLLHDPLISPFNLDNTWLGDRLAHELLDRHEAKRESRAGPIHLGKAKYALIQNLETDERCGGRIVKAACQALAWPEYGRVESCR